MSEELNSFKSYVPEFASVEIVTNTLHDALHIAYDHSEKPF